MQGRTVKCGFLLVLLIFVTREGRALITGSPPSMGCGPTTGRNHGITHRPMDTDLLSPPGARERRRFPGRQRITTCPTVSRQRGGSPLNDFDVDELVDRSCDYRWHSWRRQRTHGRSQGALAPRPGQNNQALLPRVNRPNPVREVGLLVVGRGGLEPPDSWDAASR